MVEVSSEGTEMPSEFTCVMLLLWHKPEVNSKVAEMPSNLPCDSCRCSGMTGVSSNSLQMPSELICIMLPICHDAHLHHATKMPSELTPIEPKWTTPKLGWFIGRLWIRQSAKSWFVNQWTSPAHSNFWVVNSICAHPYTHNHNWLKPGKMHKAPAHL